MYRHVKGPNSTMNSSASSSTTESASTAESEPQQAQETGHMGLEREEAQLEVGGADKLVERSDEDEEDEEEEDEEPEDEEDEEEIPHSEEDEYEAKDMSSAISGEMFEKKV